MTKRLLARDITAADLAMDSSDPDEGYPPDEVIGPKWTSVTLTGNEDGNWIDVTGFANEPDAIGWVNRSDFAVCTVVTDSSRTVDTDNGPWFPTCGKDAIGMRADFPMCQEHMDLFAPDDERDHAETLPGQPGHDTSYGDKIDASDEDARNTRPPATNVNVVINDVTIGTVVVIGNAEPIQLAATAHQTLMDDATYVVNGESFTADEIKEWWA